MNYQEKIERIALILIGVVCLLISILDFIGALEAIPWVANRISIMTLLAIGLIALYLISERNRSYQRLKETFDAKHQQILDRLNPGNQEQNILKTLQQIWGDREDDIRKIFDDIVNNTKTKDHSSLIEYLQRKYDEFKAGKVFDAILTYPWDFTLTALNLKGEFIFHPNKSMMRAREKRRGYPYSEILKLRTGELLWRNFGRSEQFGNLFPYEHFPITRFSKVYFREFPHLEAIVVFESHIDALPYLPKAIAETIVELNSQNQND